MNVFGEKIRELRKSKGDSLRKLAPIVGVAFSYLSKDENSKLDFADSPSEALIHKLAETLEGDEGVVWCHPRSGCTSNSKKPGIRYYSDKALR